MVCLACRRWNPRELCAQCRGGLRPGPERLLSFGIARSGFVHDGPARALVHRLKYEGIPAAGRVLAGEGMAHLLPPEAAALIPIPRTKWRSIRYGVEPASLLAERLSALTGVPVVTPLRPAFFSRRRAGREAGERDMPTFAVAGPAPERAVLIDDVLTTGTTLETAAAALHGEVVAAVTATVSV